MVAPSNYFLVILSFKASCPKPVVPSNGRVLNSMPGLSRHGDKVKYACNSGFRLEGSSTKIKVETIRSLVQRYEGDYFIYEINKYIDLIRCFAPEKRGYRCINFGWFLDLFMPEEQLTADFLFLPKIGRVNEITSFPRIITGGDYYNFRKKRERCSREGDNFKHCSLEVVP